MACLRFTDPDVLRQISKYFLLFIHLLFTIAGAGVIVGSTLLYVDWKHDAAAFLKDQNVPNFAVAGLVIGPIIVVLSLFGAIAGLTEQRCMLILNNLFLILSSLLFFFLGASAFLMKEELSESVHNYSGDVWQSLKSSWLQAVNTDPTAVCALQVALKCTGFATGIPYGGIPRTLRETNHSLVEAQFLHDDRALLEDWSSFCINPNNTNNPQSAPDSETFCTSYEGCKEIYDLDRLEWMTYAEGCIDKVSADVNGLYLAIGWSLFGCALLLLLTIAWNCCLFYHHAVESAELQSLLTAGDSVELGGIYSGRGRRGTLSSPRGSDPSSPLPTTPKFSRFQMSYGSNTQGKSLSDNFGSAGTDSDTHRSS